MIADTRRFPHESAVENPETISKHFPTYANSYSLRHSLPTLNYIDKDFPVEQLSPIVIKEANSRNPIYQMHKWWARRLGSVFRMLLVASFSSIEEKRKDIWTKYSDVSSLDGKIVLDPMVGGGTTMVETLRLGGKAIGIDVNPVAWFVTKKEIEQLDRTKTEDSFRQLEIKVSEKIREFYKTKCSKGHDAEIMYALWNKQIDCDKCHSNIDVLQDYVISEKKNDMIIFCPSCKSVFRRKRNIMHTTTCATCGYKFNPRIGTSRKGIVTCGSCGHRESITEAVKRNGSPLNLRLFCIEYYCSKCGKQYKKSDEEDYQKYLEAQNQFFIMRKRLPYPKEVIPDDPFDARPGNHGYKAFHQLFNYRQLLCLSLLLKEILSISDRNTREYFLLAFSSCLETNNLLCKYETKWQKTSAIFGIPAYHPVERIAENNVWGTRYGRGTFIKCYQKMLRAKTNPSKLKQRPRDAGADKKLTWFTQIADSFTELKSSEKNALLACASSESMSFIPDNSVDLVATDPPYFDNLNYSRLADFFYVWLRIGLMKDYESFGQKTSFREREAAMNGATSKTADELVESLTGVFKESYRVLKPYRPMVFTFHHTKDWAWRGLMKAIKSSGFSVVESHFVRSEGRTGYRKSGKISYDICIVCRKADEIQIEEKPRLAASRSEKWIRRLVRSGNGLQDSDVYSIVLGNLLTHSPNLLLNGTSTNEWVASVIKKCLSIKNDLKARHCDLPQHEEYIRRTYIPSHGKVNSGDLHT